MLSAKKLIVVVSVTGVIVFSLSHPVEVYPVRFEELLGARRVREETSTNTPAFSYRDVPYMLIGESEIGHLIILDIAKQLDELTITRYPDQDRGSYFTLRIRNSMPSFSTGDLIFVFYGFCKQLSQSEQDIRTIVASNSKMLYELVEFVAKWLQAEGCNKDIISRITEKLKQNIVNKDILDEDIKEGFSRPLTSIKAKEGSAIADAYKQFEEFLQVRQATASENKGVKALLGVYRVVAGRNQALADELITPLVRDLQQDISTLGDYFLPVIKYALLSEIDGWVPNNLIIPVNSLLGSLRFDTAIKWMKFRARISSMYAAFDKDMITALEEAKLSFEAVAKIVDNDLDGVQDAFDRLTVACGPLGF